MLGDCPDHCLNKWFSLATCDLYSHTVKRLFFRPCYKAHTLPSSELGDYVDTMHLPVYFVFASTAIGFLTSAEILFFRPWHYVPASPTTRLGD